MGRSVGEERLWLYTAIERSSDRRLTRLFVHQIPYKIVLGPQTPMGSLLPRRNGFLWTENGLAN